MRLTHDKKITSLFYFEESKPRTVTGVAKKLGISSSSASRNLAILYDEGYLKKEGACYSPFTLSDKIKHPKSIDEIKALEEGDIIINDEGLYFHCSPNGEEISLTIRGYKEYIKETGRRGYKYLKVDHQNIIPIGDGSVTINNIKHIGSYDTCRDIHSDYSFYGVPLVEATK